MFEYILKNKRATYAFDDKIGLKTFENTQNIDDIIKTNNNIEQLELLYSTLEQQYEDEKINIKSGKKDFIIGTIILVIMRILFLTPISFLPICAIFLFIKRKYIISMLNEKKSDKKYMELLDFLNENLIIEKEALRLLKLTDKKVVIEKEQPKIELDNSKKLDNLYSKLEIIELYLENKSNLELLYKTNNLEQTICNYLTQEEIEFITFLIAENLNTKKSEKIKKLI